MAVWEVPEDFKLRKVNTILEWEKYRSLIVDLDSKLYRFRLDMIELAEGGELGEFAVLEPAVRINIPISDFTKVLGLLCEHYDRHARIADSHDVIEEIRSRMKRQGFRNRDLVEELGSKGYVSDILNRRKALTMFSARVFRDIFDIPAEWLLDAYDLDSRQKNQASKIQASKNQAPKIQVPKHQAPKKIGE